MDDSKESGYTIGLSISNSENKSGPIFFEY